jgi:hypothetical protein
VRSSVQRPEKKVKPKEQKNWRKEIKENLKEPIVLEGPKDQNVRKDLTDQNACKADHKS